MRPYAGILVGILFLVTGCGRMPHKVACWQYGISCASDAAPSEPVKASMPESRHAPR
jgi:hypothetical protein